MTFPKRFLYHSWRFRWWNCCSYLPKIVISPCFKIFFSIRCEIIVAYHRNMASWIVLNTVSGNLLGVNSIKSLTTHSSKFLSEFKHSRKCSWQYRPQNFVNFFKIQFVKMACFFSLQMWIYKQSDHFGMTYTHLVRSHSAKVCKMWSINWHKFPIDLPFV